MALDRTNITVVDDDGTETTGTVLDAEFFDAIYDAIDAYAALLGPSEDIPFFAVAGPTALRTFTFPDADAVVFTAAGLANDALKILDTDDSHYLSIVPGSNLSADRVFTLVTGDAARTLTLSGNPTLGDWFDQAVKAASSPTFAAITIGTTPISETDIAKIDAITNGTVTASKALVVDANKDLSSLRDLTVSRTLFITNTNGTEILFTGAGFATNVTSEDSLNLTCGSGTFLSFGVTGTGQIARINTTGLIFQTDNTYDIGASGATRPRTGFFATSVVAPEFKTTTALVALGGGAAPTFGTIGGSGPATAGQNTWLRMVDSTGAAFWVPAWK